MKILILLLDVVAASLIDAKRIGPPRPVKDHVLCKKYTDDGKFFWSHGGDLTNEVFVGNNFEMTDSLKIKLWINSGANPRGPYWYDFTAFAPEKKGDDIVIETKRSWGDGEGHQFKVAFLSAKDPTKELDAYWVNVNEKCHIPSVHPARAFAGVRVMPRWYE